MDINKNSPIPLYYQLAEILREQIASGELPSGVQIPTERELCERMGISRVTVRQAIAYLIREGLLVAHPGKGTFVAEPKLSYETVSLLSFTEKMLSQGRQTSSHVLEQAVVHPPKYIVENLQLDPHERAIKIVRLRFGQEPLALESVFVPYDLCHGLEERDLAAESLYGILEQEYHLRPEHAQQSFEATIANEYEAKMFGIAEGAPMILLEGVTYTRHDEPVEYFKAVYRGDRFKVDFSSPRTFPQGIRNAQLVTLVME